MVPAFPPESGLVSQQCVLIASKLTDIIDNKDITTLNMTQHWETLAIQKYHCLQQVRLVIVYYSYIIFNYKSQKLLYLENLSSISSYFFSRETLTATRIFF